MVNVFDRHFVRYSDYAALEAQLAEVKAKNERLEKERDYWQSQHDERTRQLGMSDTDTTPPAPKVTECSTEGCAQTATVRFERRGVGSDYCHGCYMRIQTLTAAHGGER